MTDTTGRRALRLLHRDPDLARLAAHPFNVDIERADHVEAVRLASGGELEALAGDDTGGTYFRCPDGAVLYADSEGGAGLIADSADEALETLIGLPAWHDHLFLDPDAPDAELAAAVAESEEEFAEYYGPGLDADRTALLAALGLRRLPPAELVRRLHRALRRTEPEHLLLNAEELNAYATLTRRPDPGPAGEAALAEVRLARLQGRTETARCALIRLLDDIGPRDDHLLPLLAEEFTLLGDHPQAARARAFHARVARSDRD